MSSPPSPLFGQRDAHHLRRKDRPPALDFADPPPVSDRETRADRDADQVTLHPPSNRRDSRLTTTTTRTKPRLHVLGVEDTDVDFTDLDHPRSTSATSSLDPYYFGVRTPSESPVPAPPPLPRFLPKTPENGPFADPVTPGKDPASIDRRGLVGVGELATPRWARGERRDEIEIDEQVDEVDEEDIDLMPESIDDADDSIVNDRATGKRAHHSHKHSHLDDELVDMPDSPWTIEAIDGEQEEADDVSSFVVFVLSLPSVLMISQTLS